MTSFASLEPSRAYRLISAGSASRSVGWRARKTSPCTRIPASLSSRPATAAPFEREGPRGAIYALDLNEVDPRPKNLTAEFDREFQPHGLSLLRSANGRDSLFVVSHPADRHLIEIFDFAEGALVHRETVAGEALRSPNDVFAVGPRQFYVTNDHRYPSGWKRLLEDFLRLAQSDVVYFDGREFRVAAQGIAYPNGITGDPGGSSLFVASTTGRSVLRYERSPTGELTFKQEYHAATGVDNLEMGARGAIWIGAHPNLLAFLRNARDARQLSPSQVLSLELSTGRFSEAFLSRGDDLSTSSVAAVHGKWLLIGSVFESHILLCERS